jgi:hypothetical protein
MHEPSASIASLGSDAAPLHTSADADSGAVGVAGAVLDMTAPRAGKDLRPEKRRRVQSILDTLGTPLDFERGLARKVVPREWQRDLRELSPVSSTTSYLIFAWKQHPMHPDRARWCLYEAIPDALILPGRRAELASAPYWTLPKHERAGQALIVSAYQWMMYHDHRLDVRPFWCLQGETGGTPLSYDALERKYRRLLQQPVDPLAVGDLPYAGWDRRVRDAVQARDRLLKLAPHRALRDVSAAELNSVREAREKAFRTVLWDTMAERLRPNAELLGRILRDEGHNGNRRAETREEADAASVARDYFIEFGRVPDPRQFAHRPLLISL